MIIKQLERGSLKKSGLQRGSNPWPPWCRCDALPTELWSHICGLRAHVRLICCIHDRVLGKPVNATPGSKVNRSLIFFSYAIFYVPGVVWDIQNQNRTPNNINRKPHRKVTKLKSKFSLILCLEQNLTWTTQPWSSVFSLGARYLGAFVNKTFIPLTLVGYEKVISNHSLVEYLLIDMQLFFFLDVVK